MSRCMSLAAASSPTMVAFLVPTDLPPGADGDVAQMTDDVATDGVGHCLTGGLRDFTASMNRRQCTGSRAPARRCLA